MHLRELGRAMHRGDVQDLNIITHSGLNRYALQVLLRDSDPFILQDGGRRPRFWKSLAQLHEALRRYDITPPRLQVLVAQDEVIGR